MSIFKYTAVNSGGKMVKATISASDKGGAARLITQKGLSIISIDESFEAGSKGADSTDFLTAISRVKTKDVILFFRMFSTLIISNVTITESLNILREQTDNRKFKKILSDIQGKIEGGMPLSDAFSGYPKLFPEMTVNMIRAGELGGILDVVLGKIADDMEARAALKSKMILSLIYPAVVLVASVGVIIFLVAFVIPKFATLLGGGALPANTQFLLDVSAFLTKNGIPIIVSTAGITGILIVMLVMPETRVHIDRYKIYIPVIGPVFHLGVVVQFSKTFASLLGSGISLIEALKASKGTISNLAVKKVIDEMIAKVVAGEPLSAAVAEGKVFTPMFEAMVKIGEHSGLLDKSMETVGDLHEKALADKIAKMSAMIEPALIIILGGIVGFVAWGLIAGMLAMYGKG